MFTDSSDLISVRRSISDISEFVYNLWDIIPSEESTNWLTMDLSFRINEFANFIQVEVLEKLSVPKQWYWREKHSTQQRFPSQSPLWFPISSYPDRFATFWRATSNVSAFVPSISDNCLFKYIRSSDHWVSKVDNYVLCGGLRADAVTRTETLINLLMAYAINRALLTS